jgi:hypothetical protein
MKEITNALIRSTIVTTAEKFQILLMLKQTETKQLTPWIWARFEWLSVVQLLKKFVALYRKKPKVHYRVSNSPTLDYSQSQIHPVHTTPYYSPNILHTHIRLCLPSGLFPSGFSISNLRAISLFSQSCDVSREVSDNFFLLLFISHMIRIVQQMMCPI